MKKQLRIISLRILAATGLLLMLAGCGQTGPLFLPTTGTSTASSLALSR